LYVGTTDEGFYKVDLNENITYFKMSEMNVVDIATDGNKTPDQLNLVCQ
jgi:hypothetical protein